MKIAYLLVLLLVAAPVYAGTLAVNGSSVAPVYSNSGDRITVLNATLVASDSNINITSLNITVHGGDTGNISAVEVRNLSGGLVGASTANISTTVFTVTVPNGFVLSQGAQTLFSVFINASETATRQINLSLNLSQIGTAGGDTISLQSTMSKGVQLQDVHATADVSPRFVDTGVFNQTFIYAITPTGSDGLSTINVSVPTGYAIHNVTAVTINGVNTTTNHSVRGKSVIINMSPTTQPLKVYFSLNTSASAVPSSVFSVLLSGANLTNINTRGSQNVTTQQIIRVDNIALTKGTAIVNGSDYWEFSLVLNFSANVSGTVQMTLTNWTDAAGKSISLQGCSPSCATLRNTSDFGTTNKAHVNQTYIGGQGIGVSQDANTTLTAILRMVIPLSTEISSTWSATYTLLFRALA